MRELMHYLLHGSKQHVFPGWLDPNDRHRMN
jgi:hypothetical protein